MRARPSVRTHASHGRSGHSRAFPIMTPAGPTRLMGRCKSGRTRNPMNLQEMLPAGLTGLEQLQRMLAGGRPPIAETLDYALTEVGEGWAVFEGTPGLRVYNPIGVVHGGYAA